MSDAFVGGDMNALLDRLIREVETPHSSAGPPPDSLPPPPPPPPPQTTPVSASPSLPLGALLSNPALLSALPSLLNGLSAGGGSGGKAGGRPGHADRHTALLCAIKPYLSPGRQEAAETAIRLCRVWDALERAGVSLPHLLSSFGGTPSAGVTHDGEVT